MNTMLDCLLSHTCTVAAVGESIVNLRTVEVLTNTTGVACHVQVSFAEEIPMGFGYEEKGTWDLWVSSTAPVSVGNRVTATSGPHSGRTWNVRAPKQAADESGLEHRAWKMELDTSG